MNISFTLYLASTFISSSFAGSQKFRKRNFLRHHARGNFKKRSNPTHNEDLMISENLTSAKNNFDDLTWKLKFYRKMNAKVGHHDSHLINHYFEKYIVNGIMN